MKVYVYPADSVMGGSIESREAIHFTDRKAQFNKEDQHGYLGAKLDCVYFTERQAERAKAYDIAQENAKMFGAFKSGT